VNHELNDVARACDKSYNNDGCGNNGYGNNYNAGDYTLTHSVGVPEMAGY
jgi:hypothetical protein